MSLFTSVKEKIWTSDTSQTASRGWGKRTVRPWPKLLRQSHFMKTNTGMTFHPVVLTNREFAKSAHQLSRANQVEMYERKWLMRSLKQYPVTWIDVNMCQFQKTTPPMNPVRNF